MKVPPPQVAEFASIYDLQIHKTPFKLKIKTEHIDKNQRKWILIKEKKATDQQSSKNIRVSMNMEQLQSHIIS